MRVFVRLKCVNVFMDACKEKKNEYIFLYPFRQSISIFWMKRNYNRSIPFVFRQKKKAEQWDTLENHLYISYHAHPLYLDFMMVFLLFTIFDVVVVFFFSSFLFLFIIFKPSFFFIISINLNGSEKYILYWNADGEWSIKRKIIEEKEKCVAKRQKKNMKWNDFECAWSIL